MADGQRVLSRIDLVRVNDQVLAGAGVIGSAPASAQSDAHTSSSTPRYVEASIAKRSGQRWRGRNELAPEAIPIDAAECERLVNAPVRPAHPPAVGTRSAAHSETRPATPAGPGMTSSPCCEYSDSRHQHVGPN